MKNNILILLMSCNQPLYLEEEQACRETFLKDAEKDGIQYYFYRGMDEEHNGLSFDEENHVMYLPVPDGLGATSRKTVLAMNEALKIEGWDYIVKTNVSTWLDIPKIEKAVDKWEGKEDRNIYGARFLANDASKNVPFPRGHFTILSRTLVEGIVEWSPRLIYAEGFPKTDDTLICLSSLYFVQKVLKDSYRSRLLEVPSVISWTDEIQNATEWPDALSIRCKSETDMNETPDNMRKAHKLKRSKNQNKVYRRPVNMVETKYGLMTYETYEKVCAAFDRAKRVNMVQDEKPPQAQQITPDPENRLVKIREKLKELRK